MGSGGSVNLSDIDGFNGFFLSGETSGDQPGFSVATADVNGDGTPDLIIGARNADVTGSNNEGKTYVVFGDSLADLDAADGAYDGTALLANLDGYTGFVINGAVSGDRSGRSVAAGDVNGDGVADVIIGAPEAGSNTGVAYVVFGGAAVGGSGTINLSALSGGDGFVVNAAQSGEYLGYSVSFGGDLNGDGIGDIVIGAQYFSGPNGSEGKTYIVFGGSSVGASGSVALTSLNGASGTGLVGIDNNDNTRSVGSAGDVNGDGNLDIIIGSRNADSNGSSSGEAYVVFGGSISGNTLPVFNLADVDGTIGFVVNGINDEDQSGVSVASVDFNNDGFSDLLIGANQAEESTQTAEGETYIVFGGAGLRGTASVSLSTLNGTDGVRITGEATPDNSGFSVASAGDINNDGVADLIIGSLNLAAGGSTNRGAAHVVFGGQTLGASADLASFQDGTNGVRFIGEAASDQAGASVSGIGDVNGDGVDDFIIGALSGDGAVANTGAAYVIFGKVSGSSFSATTLPTASASEGFKLNGAVVGDNAGRAVSGLGDVNGDGVDDFLVTAQLADPNGISSGAAYVVFGGQTFGTAVNLSAVGSTVSGFQIAGLTGSDRLGFREIRSAGDVNGDGIADIIVGARGGDNAGSDSGETYVVFGSSSSFGSSVDLSTSMAPMASSSTVTPSTRDPGHPSAAPETSTATALTTSSLAPPGTRVKAARSPATPSSCSARRADLVPPSILPLSLPPMASSLWARRPPMPIPAMPSAQPVTSTGTASTMSPSACPMPIPIPPRAARPS